METLNLYQKLLDIQSKIMGLKKDTQGYNFKYTSGGKILEHIKPLMNSHGIILKTEVISIDNERQDYSSEKEGVDTIAGKTVKTIIEKKTSEILSKVMLKFTWIDCVTGEKDENLFGANGQSGWDKGVGSALTYGERYFLLKYFHIDTDEDDVDLPKGDEVNIKETQVFGLVQLDKFKKDRNKHKEKLTTYDKALNMIKGANYTISEEVSNLLKQFYDDLNKPNA